MRHIDELDLAEHCGDLRAPIYGSLTHLNGFNFSVDIPGLSGHGQATFDHIRARLLVAVGDLLETSKLHGAEWLTSFNGGDRAWIQYRDDRYDFDVEVTETRFAIRRSGSSWDDFHAWYRAIMPSVMPLINEVLFVVESTGSGEKPRCVSGQYDFRFLLHHLRAEGAGAVDARNAEVLRRLFSLVPGPSGVLEPAEEALADGHGRIDVAISRYVEYDVGLHWREIYVAEAPGNRKYSTLWPRFAVLGETYESPDTGDRQMFDAERFVAGYRMALGACHTRAVQGFLTSLMDGWLFRATSTRPD